jgi:hypothetical protein
MKNTLPGVTKARGGNMLVVTGRGKNCGGQPTCGPWTSGVYPLFSTCPC